MTCLIGQDLSFSYGGRAVLAGVNLRIDPAEMTVEQVDSISELAQQHKGNCGLMFHIKNGPGKDKRIVSHKLKVCTSREFLKQLQEQLGSKNVWVE